MGGAYQWPGLNKVMQYRKIVRQLVCDVINSAPLSLPVTMENPWVGLCILLMYGKHNFNRLNQMAYP